MSTNANTNTTINKPSVDKRDYRHCQIGKGPNTMDVLLISDPATDKASAAMDIHVGQLNDGPDRMGLAHFCEHMLFIGTDKYPTENDYDSYLTTHGGSSNAYTDLEHTCYYFDVQSEPTVLDGALDRFARFFIGPLFTESAVEREVQAVDSEHHKNLQQDMWRMHQLAKSVLLPASHPYASFGSGNQESLPVTTPDDSTHIRDHLVAFYQKYYRRSLSLYKLVILGKESLDELEAMLHKYFDEFADSLQESKEECDTILQEFFPPLSDTWRVPQRLHLVPVRQVHTLELQFPLPPQYMYWGSKPTRYLSHLIGHEGQGSLLSLLKAKQFALDLYADGSSKSCRAWSIFTIHLGLTEQGIENVDEVTRIVFAYLDMLKRPNSSDALPPAWIQEELRTVGDLQFRFLSQRDPMDYTSGIANWMHTYPPAHYLSGPYTIADEFDPVQVSKCLKHLTPDNALVLVSSPTFSDSLQNVQTEKWYGTQYQVVVSPDAQETFPESWSIVKASDYPELTLPHVNDMIATEFDLLPSTFLSSVPTVAPQCIFEKSSDNQRLVELWYKPDNVFEMPKVNLLLAFSSPLANASAIGIVATQLLVELVEEQTIEFSYLASMAGLHCDVSVLSKPSAAGVELQVSGYSHKAHVLVEKFVDVLLNPMQDSKPEEVKQLLARVMYKLEQRYQSFLVAQPYQHAIYSADLVLDHNAFGIPAKMAALKHISNASSPLDEVLGFASRFWKDCRLKALVHGNVLPQEAKTLVSDVWGQLSKIHPNEEVSRSDPVERRVVQLAPGSSTLYRLEEFNPSNTNSCLELMLQMGNLELKDNATLAFCHHLIREPAFNQLRTEEQLGYIVHTSIKTSGDNIKALLVLIQSDGFDPIHVEGRVESFLAGFRSRIQAMTAEEFQTHVSSVMASFLEKNKNLGEESTKYWHVIMNQTYHFQRLQDLAENVKDMTKDRVLQFWDKYIAASAPCRRKFCIQVFATAHQNKMNEPVAEHVVQVKDPKMFQRSMSLYPLPECTPITTVELEG